MVYGWSYLTKNISKTAPKKWAEGNMFTLFYTKCLISIFDKLTISLYSGEIGKYATSRKEHLFNIHGVLSFNFIIDIDEKWML